MLTQCPECQTVFRVRPEQLQAAGGKVRCSRCHTVFNAAEQRFAPEQEANAPAQSVQPTSRERSRPTPRKPEQRHGVQPDAKPNPAPRKKPHISPADTTDKADAKATSPDTVPDNGVAKTGRTQTVLRQTTSKEPTPSGNEPLRQPAGPRHPMATVKRKNLPEETTTETDGLSGEKSAKKVSPDPRATSEKDRAGEASTGADAAGKGEHTEKRSPTQKSTAQASAEVSPPRPAISNRKPKASDKSAREKGKGPASVPEMSRPAEQVTTPEEEPDTPPSLSTSDAEKLLETMRRNLNARQATQDRAEPNRDASPSPSQESAPGKIDTNKHDSEREGEGKTSEEEFESSLFDLFTPHEGDSNGIEAPGTTTGDEVDNNWDLFSEQNIETLSNHQERGAKPRPAKPTRTIQADIERKEPAAQTTPPEAVETAPLSREVTPTQTDTEQQPEPEEEKLQASSEEPKPTPLPDQPPEDGEKQDEAIPTAPEETPPTTRESYSLPLQRHQSSGQGLRIALWGSGILLLCATLGLQYLYFFRDSLVENTTLRPVLSQMCQLTGCQLPPRRAVDKITLVDHLVQSHPRYKNSLLITATLMNRADFTQPFPTLEVVMTDLQQKVIARRRFSPEQYLTGGGKHQQFTPNTEIPLMLEVVDPGDAAVGFEFHFY